MDSYHFMLNSWIYKASYYTEWLLCTITDKWLSLAMHLSLCRMFYCQYVTLIHPHGYLMYSILNSWGNKESLTIGLICLCKCHSKSIATATANPPHARTLNQLEHRLLIMYREYSIMMGSHAKCSTRLYLVLYLPLNPTNCTVFSMHHS